MRKNVNYFSCVSVQNHTSIPFGLVATLCLSVIESFCQSKLNFALLSILNCCLAFQLEKFVFGSSFLANLTTAFAGCWAGKWRVYCLPIQVYSYFHPLFMSLCVILCQNYATFALNFTGAQSIHWILEMNLDLNFPTTLLRRFWNL